MTNRARAASVLLADLDIDDSRQPYHAGLERGERMGAAVVMKARHDAQARAATASRAAFIETSWNTPLAPWV